MPTPEIPHSVLSRFRRLAPRFRTQIPFGLTQQHRPTAANSERRLKLNPLAIRNPKSPINYEPRGVESLRRALHLGDDFLRDRSRSLLITRKVHRVFRAALG